ncbi:hypothetical protein D3C87_1025470 [compost metagenome]
MVEIIKAVSVIFSANRIPPSISSEISIINNPENKKTINKNGIPFKTKKISSLILLLKTAKLCLKVLNSMRFGISEERIFASFEIVLGVFNFLVFVFRKENNR